jgi:O-antigen/teichoic acid export membrane protein
MNNVGLSHFIKSILNIFDANNLSKKAFLNAIASLLDYSAKILVALFVTPFMVSGLGAFYYGAWQILLRFIGYMSPASGRPTQALKFILAKEQNSSDYESKRKYVGSTFVVLGIFLPILIIPGAIISWFIPYWIKAPDPYIWSIRIACGILVLNLLAVTLTAIPQAVLEGENKGYKRMGLATFLVILGGGLTWFSLYIKSGIIGISVAALILSIIQFAFFLMVVRTYSPWFGISKPSKNIVGEFLKLSGWFMAWNLINNLMFSSDVVILGLLNSAESVTLYTLSKYAPETLITFISMMVFSILPGLSGIIGSGDLAKAAKVRGEIMILTWLIVTVMGTEILLWNRAFISMWVGENHFFGEFANLLVVVSVIQFVLIRNDANIIDLTLRLKQKVILGTISIILSLVTASLLIVFFNLGIFGVILGVIIGRLVLSVAYPRLVGRLLNIQFTSQITSFVRPTLVSITLFVGACGIEYYLSIFQMNIFGNWAILLVAILISSCVVLLFAYFFGLSGAQKIRMLYRVQSVFHTSAGE